MRLSRSIALLALAAFWAAACAEERPPINRVQPNAIKKSFFVGEKLLDPSDDPEFWAQGTLIDVGYGASQDGLFTSTYGQPLSRVKFVIQENLLVARLTYERIAGSDGKGAGRTSTDGIIVAAYPIESHFDIQREYNSSTGEELNVVGENSSDRPWYEREYIRVDWSKNLNTDSYDFDTLSQTGVYGGVSYEPLAYYVNDPTSDDAPHFDEATGYFDVTTKAFAVPQQVDLSYLGWGIDKFPACFLPPDVGGGNWPVGNCNPVELTIRQSFRKVVDSDYEPEDWDGHKFRAYGAFTADRFGYARNYGMSDEMWHRFVARYNIWERSHYYDDPDTMTGPVECFTPETTPAGEDPNRDLQGARDEENKPTGDGTDDECSSVAAKREGLHKGSRCDSFSQKCTLPYRDRKPVTLPWYFTSFSNPKYFNGTVWAANEWDVALRSAVVTARYAECVRTEPAATCKAQYPVIEGQMEEYEDANALTREIDDCRTGHPAYAGKDCSALAEELGKKRGYSKAVISLARMEEMIVLCHSPVEAGDHQACGQPRLPAGVTAAQCWQARKDRDEALMATCNAALNVRIGDLRYHQVNVIPIPQTPSPWGIMVDSVDPLTGMKVAASVNVWSHVTDFWTQNVVDMGRFMKGELKTSDVTDGTYVYDWSKAAEAAAGGGLAPKFSKANLEQRLSDTIGADITQATRPDRFSPQQARFEALGKALKGTRFHAGAPSSTRAVYDARRRRAIGTELEAALTTKPMIERVANGPVLDGRVLTEFASPLRSLNPSVVRDIRRAKELALAKRGVCVLNEAPAPMSMTQLSDQLEAKFGKFNADDPVAKQMERAEKMRWYLAEHAHYTVIAHEMGHSIGLRHNFVSSSDAFGFRPQYWQLRTRNGEVTKACTDLAASEAEARDCVGPRYYDPVTTEEKDNLIWAWMQSSIMEYYGEVSQDIIMGLGIYDYAAARMFYGGAVSVFADESYAHGTPRGTGMVEKLGNFGGLVGMIPQLGSRYFHYSQYQKNFELIRDCEKVNVNDFKPANYDEAVNGKWSPVLDGLMVAVDGEYSRCKSQPVDYVQWRALHEVGSGDAYYAGPAVDRQDRVRVPYGFASDEWADVGNVSVFRHDNGADLYEFVDFEISQMEINHIFDNFRRGRQTFNVLSASMRTLERYNEKLRDAGKALALIVNIVRDSSVYNHTDFESEWADTVAYFGAESNVLASTIVFDQFAREMARPESGPHYFMPGDTVLRSSRDPDFYGVTVLDVPEGAYAPRLNGQDNAWYGNMAIGGRLMENQLCDNDKCGEFSRDYTMNVGSYYDKAWTAMLLTESVDNFISDSRKDFTDGRYRAISFADMFPDGYRRWLSNNLTGDDVIKGPRVATDANGIPLTTPVQSDVNPDDELLYPTSGIGWTSWTPKAGPKSCFWSSASIQMPNNTIGTVCAAEAPANTAVIDPQIGWEQQKFLIAWTMMYLPENQQRWWLDQMYLWERIADGDPIFDNRIEFHSPTGKIYVAKTFGKETIFGKEVQKGIAARVLEYANSLLAKAYVVRAVDINGDDVTDWYEPSVNDDGTLTVQYDPAFRERQGCSKTDSSDCKCNENAACHALERYLEIPYFLRQALATYGLADPTMRGIY